MRAAILLSAILISEAIWGETIPYDDGVVKFIIGTGFIFFTLDLIELFKDK